MKKGGATCKRRDLLLSAPMLTGFLLCPKTSVGQNWNTLANLELKESQSEIGRGFEPTVSVGNVCGRVVGLEAFNNLAAAAPVDLVRSFVSAVTDLSSRSINSASSDYFEFRMDSSGGKNDIATLQISNDVLNDHAIALIITRAIEHDLSVADFLKRDSSLSVSQFRVQMLKLRDQLHILEAEERRAEGGGAIYLPIQERSRRSLKDENARLENEISRLRRQLAKSQARAAALTQIILNQ